MSINWNSDETVVFPTSQGVAVYRNQIGDVCIAQEGANGNEDSYIYIPIIQVKQFIDAVNKAATGDGNEVV